METPDLSFQPGTSHHNQAGKEVYMYWHIIFFNSIGFAPYVELLSHQVKQAAIFALSASQVKQISHQELPEMGQ